MRNARTSLLFVGLLVLGLFLVARGVAAEEKVSATTWRATVLETAAPTRLSDLRSPILQHETHVLNGAAFPIGDTSLDLKVAAGGRSVLWHHTRTASNGSADTRSGSLRLPGLLTLLDVHGVRYPLWVRAAPSNDGAFVGSAYGLALPLKDALAHVVDSDLDGVVGSAGDGLVAPESRTVGPWGGEAWSATGGRRFRRTEAGTWETAAVPLPHAQDKDHTAAWCLLQWRRQQCGLLSVGYDTALEAAMRKHAAYAASSGAQTHEEIPSHPAYTKEGDAAGRSSVIGWEETSMLAGLSVQLATMYHRTRVLQPGLTHTALVLHEGTFMLNIFARRGGPLENAVLIYPPHGMEKVLTLFNLAGENPMPTGERTGHLGTAVNVFSEPLLLAEPPATAPTLEVLRGRKRKPIEGALHYPGHPPGPDVERTNRGNVSLVPSLPLKPRTDYACSTRVVMPDGRALVYDWTFRTGRPPKRR